MINMTGHKKPLSGEDFIEFKNIVEKISKKSTINNLLEYFSMLFLIFQNGFTIEFKDLMESEVKSNKVIYKILIEDQFLFFINYLDMADDVKVMNTPIIRELLINMSNLERLLSSQSNLTFKIKDNFIFYINKIDSIAGKKVKDSLKIYSNESLI